MTIFRNAYHKLLHWKNAQTPKPLLIRGARQVGKTTLVREFSREFDNYIELNLERSADRRLFQINDVRQILNAAFLLKNLVLKPGTTLLFIDEIQESPEAIQQLRYFYEDLPEYHVIAAGSLLEFALSKVPSFPVGRVDYLYLHPLNFEEFLGALGNQAALNAMHQVPVPEYAHETLLHLFHEYAIVGGMPELVAHYIRHKNIAALSPLYGKLWQAYKDDIEKYSPENSQRHIIRHVIEAAPYEIDRIKFEGFGNSNYRSREVGEALRLLDLSKVVQLLYPTTALKPPISPDLKKRPRLQFLDTGMLNHILMQQGEMLSLNNLDDFQKGKTVQHLVTQELISIHDDLPYKPLFWVREKKTANSEVDIVYHFQNKVIPIEVKAGKQGRLRSLHQFVEQAGHPFALRLYGGRFLLEKAQTPQGTPYLLLNLPYYLGTQIPSYIQYLLKQAE